ncbi:TPA: trp operon leader peptide [Escherichia coli]|nr:trp operon leader peptide [Escherichia coli]HDV2370371.1 trp operon leader peptide [Escherichia coli]
MIAIFILKGWWRTS